MITVHKDYADIKDKNAVVDLIFNYMNEMNSPKEKLEIENSLQNALMETKRSLLFLISINNRYIGFAFVNIGSGIESGSDYLWINEIYIDKNYRGKKFSSALLKYIEAWCYNNHIKAICCITGINNRIAQSMFSVNEYKMNKVEWIEKSI